MTFDEMAEIEPKLKDLLSQAQQNLHLSYRNREHFWYRNLKKQMHNLVGFEAKDQRLTSCECYDTVYHTLIKALKV